MKDTYKVGDSIWFNKYGVSYHGIITKIRDGFGNDLTYTVDTVDGQKVVRHSGIMKG